MSICVTGLSEAHLPWLLRLPWTIKTRHITDETPAYYYAQCGELSCAIATGATEAELETEFWDSLTSSLLSYLHHNDPIPVPLGAFSGGGPEPADSATTV